MKEKRLDELVAQLLQELDDLRLLQSDPANYKREGTNDQE